MALGDYSKIIYKNGESPAISAGNLNNNEDKTKELDTAAASVPNLYIPKSIATAANDFIVGTGESTVAKKTAAETTAILAASLSWADMTPTLAWEGTAPLNLTTVYRYLKIGKICFIKISIEGGDGNGATQPIITLPNDTFLNEGYGKSMLACYLWTGGSGTDPFAYMAVASKELRFHRFTTLVDGASFGIYISGAYALA